MKKLTGFLTIFMALVALLCTAAFAAERELPQGRAAAGKYTFELGQDGELWLLKDLEHGTVLPDVGKAAREKGIRFNGLKAEALATGLRVEATYTQFDMSEVTERYITVYLYSSLEWVLKNLSAEYLERVEVSRTNNGAMVMRQVQVGEWGTELQWAWGNAGYTSGAWHAIPSAGWGQGRFGVTLLPHNGKTFVARDGMTQELYASWDGQSWTCLKDTFLAADLEQGMSRGWPTYDAAHVLKWMGSEYIACRRGVETVHGMMGSSGGVEYSPYNTKIVFADANFAVTGEYDFGRQVVGVSYANGVYYAEVSENVKVNAREYFRDAETVIYKSADKKNWEKTDLAQVFNNLGRIG